MISSKLTDEHSLATEANADASAAADAKSVPPAKPDSAADSAATRAAGSTRQTIFYGWVMLGVAVAAQVCTSPGQTYGVSLFNPSFQQAFDLTEAQLTGAYLAGTVLASFLLPGVGAAMDRLGLRLTMTAVVVGLGLACVWTSLVQGLYGLFLAFLLLRMLGQGALTLLASNTLAMWWHARLGTVSGIFSLAGPASMAVMPLTIELMIGQLGWRWTYAALGLGVWAVMLPLLAVVFRNRPEDIGQQPDGGLAPSAGRPAAEANSPEVSLSWWQAVSSRSYALLIAANAAYALITTGLVFNIKPLFAEFGFGPGYAAGSISMMALLMAVGQLGGGWLADRQPLPAVLTVGVGLMAAGVGVLLVTTTLWQAFLYAAVYGFGQGVMLVCVNTAFPRYYGRLHLGKIRGTATTIIVGASAAGPFLMSVIRQWQGSYQWSLVLFTVALAATAAAMPWATAPRRPAPAVRAGE